MATIDTKVELWKNKLLDLGKRNRLLNYKETARSNLKITAPDYEELFTRLVRNEEELEFPLDKNDSTNEEMSEEITLFDEENIEEEEEPTDISLSEIRTNKPNGELQRVLRSLRNKAKTAMEEQGINVLYLCFGFLKWTEADHSHIQYSSPLILVPITLTVESLLSPYVMKLHEDEIVVNPTLAYKLDSDFGISLPSFDETTKLDDYFNEVRNVVSPNGWSVSTEVGMSLLSFLKINMYEDLRKHHDTIVSNPVVRTLSGDPTAMPKFPTEINDFNFDKDEKPQNVFQIVDADSSQQEAILLAKKGISFVLQGPPGTGKSQTITNIIAESLADGKKVLFVSEKMAALEVVHKRLTGAGLNDFCLVLHSHKTSKRNVLDQLDAVLALAEKKADIKGEAYKKLDRLQRDRDYLNNYADQVYTKIIPLGKTIFEANGIIADLDEKGYKDIVFAIPNIRNISREDLDSLVVLLEKFSATIGKMTDDYKSNPWRDAKLPYVTNEFRHDANAHISVFLPVLANAKNTVDLVFEEADLEYPKSVNGIMQAEKVLAALQDSYEVPTSWITDKNSNEIAAEIDEYSSMQSECQKLVEQIKDCSDMLDDNQLHIESVGSDLMEITNQSKLLSDIVAELGNDKDFHNWRNFDNETIINLYEAAKAQAEKIHALIGEIRENYEDSIFEIDYEDILNRFKTEYTSIFKVFKKSYKEDKNVFLMSSKTIRKKISDDEMLETINMLRTLAEYRDWYNTSKSELDSIFGDCITSENSDYDAVGVKIENYIQLKKMRSYTERLLSVSKQFAEREKSIRERFESLYNGLFTDWNEVRNAMNWAVKFGNVVEQETATKTFIEKVCASKEYANKCFEYKDILTKERTKIQNGLSWYAACFDNPEQFDSMDLGVLYGRMDACLKGLSLLEEWIDFRTARENCVKAGLEEYVSTIETDRIPSRDIVPIFEKRFYRLWLDAVQPDYPAVLNFRRRNQEQTIEDFAKLDTTQFDIARARIRTKLINELPTSDHFTSGVDEMSILKRELKKQRKIMPIRKLFQSIPNLLLTLKPCLMMSPLSVSLFLEAESYSFDIVIFDEASQVYTENAIGAIARGKQVVIAGDSKQLPPTNFFQATVSENGSDFDADDDNDEYEVYDSILDEANLFPEKTLKWHYRSRHESLIAFSNAKIYQNKLITFPSNIEKRKDIGVEYIYVPEGFYDRGGRKGNIPEAKKVAELVFEHFKTHPKQSIGVIAFGEVQQIAIESAVRMQRLLHQEYEDFFNEEKEEPFFIKSLENVQGDERDTIIFSIGYAKDAAGVFRMNFGPLGKSGGERRLNVAITRAKYNVKLVGSILPTDINVDAISTEGPILLRSYIDYARNGQSVLDRELTESDIISHDSPFEESVYRFLEKRGYKLRTQVGCSGYRIDIGVMHPEISGVYVLGVECDGASYHSAKTARERDRLRQSVLESMGWSIYRVWSTDWIKDPITEGEKLIEAIDTAIKNYRNSQSNLETQPERNSMDEYVDEKTTTSNNEGNPYGFGTYKPIDFNSIKNSNGVLTVRECVSKIINTEYPVHYDVICQYVAPLLNREKATVVVKNAVDMELRYLNNYERRGDFFFPRGYKTITVRYPNNRKIQHIHPEELAAAMLIVLKTFVGPTRAALSDEVARVYGFSRTGPQIKAAMESAIDYLIKRNEIEEVEGKLRIKK